MTEKFAQALRLLQEEGASFRLIPDGVEILVGRLQVTHEGPGPCSSRGITVAIDGNHIETMLSEIEIRAAVNEIISFTVKLRGIA